MKVDSEVSFLEWCIHTCEEFYLLSATVNVCPYVNYVEITILCCQLWLGNYGELFSHFFLFNLSTYFVSPKENIYSGFYV